MKAKNFFKSNICVFIFLGLSIFIELVSLVFVDCKPYLSAPIYGICLISVVLCLVFLMPNQIVKQVLCVASLVGQAVLNLGFIFLYDSNGTYFEWAMVNQRSDAHGTIEELSLRWGLFAICVVVILAFIAACVLIDIFVYKKHIRHFKNGKVAKILLSVLLCFCSAFIVFYPTIEAVQNRNLSYVERFLYGDASNKYQRLGISSNAVYEMINGTVTNTLVKHDSKGVEDFVYSGGTLEHSPYFGISKGNNLVYILVESWEWYPFLTNCTPEQAEVLYPNLLKFMDNSIYASNFYSREKTDTAETLALIGSNPTNKYINYDFPKNAYPWALPNMFKESVLSNGNTIKQVCSFHQNYADFYNRKTLHKSFGFDKFYADKDMEAYGLELTWRNKVKERTFDSKAIEVMKDIMFPQTQANEQYFTFWITFSMHGVYNERKTFKEAGYYDLLDSVGAYPEGGKKQNYLRTYAAAVVDFDRAVGTMMQKLKENNQLDNTTIVMFGDHNTYYNNLSLYAKDISYKFTSELYRIPLMIYDTKLFKQYTADNSTNAVSKFTTTADMLPTILDIFGIEGYKNLYFGSSIFTKNESIIFSRAYGIFLTDKLMCFSANKLLYTVEGFSDADYDDFIARAKIHLNKLEYLDKIYYNNYFKKYEYKKPA